MKRLTATIVLPQVVVAAWLPPSACPMRLPRLGIDPSFNEMGLACLDPRWAGGRPCRTRLVHRIWHNAGTHGLVRPGDQEGQRRVRPWTRLSGRRRSMSTARAGAGRGAGTVLTGHVARPVRGGGKGN